MSFLTEEGATSELYFTLAYKGNISAKSKILDNLSYFKSIDIVMKDPSVKELKDSKSIKLILFGYDTKAMALKAHEITVNIDPSEFTTNEEAWSVTSRLLDTSPKLPAGSFAIADSEDLSLTNIYYMDRRNKRVETFFSRIQFNKKDSVKEGDGGLTFSDIYPVTVDANNEDETKSIFCKRLGNTVNDQCVMSTNGSLAYKASIPIVNPQ